MKEIKIGKYFCYYVDTDLDKDEFVWSENKGTSWINLFFSKTPLSLPINNPQNVSEVVVYFEYNLHIKTDIGYGLDPDDMEGVLFCDEISIIDNTFKMVKFDIDDYIKDAAEYFNITENECRDLVYKVISMLRSDIIAETNKVLEENFEGNEWEVDDDYFDDSSLYYEPDVYPDEHPNW